MKTWVFAAVALGGLTAFLGQRWVGESAYAQAKPAGAPKAEAAPAKAPAKTEAAPTEGKAPSAAELAGGVTKGQPAKPRVIDFEDETIRGTLTKPEGDFIDARKRGKQKSLIKIRPHFVPELLKSADDL